MLSTAGDTVVDVVVDQSPFGLGYRTLHRMKLRREIKARPTVLDHRDHTPQVTFGTFQPGGDGGVACMDMGF